MKRKILALLATVGLVLGIGLSPAQPAMAVVGNQSTAWNSPGTPWPIHIKFHDGYQYDLPPGWGTSLTHGGFYGIYNGNGTCVVVWYASGGVWYYQTTIIGPNGWTTLVDGKAYGLNGGYRNSRGGCDYTP